MCGDERSQELLVHSSLFGTGEILCDENHSDTGDTICSSRDLLSRDDLSLGSRKAPMFWTKCPESVVDNFGFDPKFALNKIVRRDAVTFAL